MRRKALFALFGLLLVASSLNVALSQPLCTDSNIKVFSYQHPKIARSSFHYLGSNSQGVINQLSDGHLVYSQNGGVSWSELPDLTVSGAPIVSANGQNAIAVSSKDTGLWLLRFRESTMYEGELQVYKQVLLTEWTPQYFVPHPRDASVILAFGKSKACQTTPSSPQCTFSVYMSRNFGETWKEAVSYAAGYVSWAPSNSTTDPLEYTILAEDYAEKTGPIVGRPLISKRLVSADLRDALTAPNPLPTPPVLVVRQTYVLGTLTALGVVFVTKPRSTTNPSLADIILYTSHDGGTTFKHAKLPTSSDKSERFYTILDVSGGAVFVNVLFTNSNWGNIYTSDEHGDNYALNLRYGSRAFSGQADFAPIRGIEGIYMANVELTPEVAGAELGSRITYDRGGEWFPIPAPESERPSCSDPRKCFLNLRSQSSSNKANFFSRSKAVGIVMGTGNVGATLSTSEFGTYLSRDAGKAWRKIFGHRHTFDISQNGGVILTARDDTMSNSIFWSSNDGLSFKECLLPPFGTMSKRSVASTTEMSSQTEQEAEQHGLEAERDLKDWTIPTYDEALLGPRTISLDSHLSNKETSAKREAVEIQGATILNINSIPSKDASARFLITARTTNEQVIVYMDFNATESRTCQGWDTPNLPNSDYEAWSPSDVDGDGCILGRKIIYARRKASAECWIAHSAPPKILLEVECLCSRQDYMCDYCYAPNITHPSICQLDCPGHNPNTPPQNCQGSYRRSSGYRFVAGDRCVKGEQLLGPLVPCPSGPPSAPSPVAPPPVLPPSPAPAPGVPPPQTGPPSASPPVAGPPSHKKPSKIIIIALIAGMALVLLIAIVATLFFLSRRNAQVRHSLMRCVPDSWLPAYMPPDREEGPHYHRLQGTSLNAGGNDDIFNDDEFLQEDANVLDLDD